MPHSRQALGTGTLVQKLDELYRQADLADKELGKFMAMVNREVPQGRIVHPPLKKRADAEAKLTRAGANDPPEDLKDIVRATIKYDKLEAMIAARNYIFTSNRVAEDHLGNKSEKNRYMVSPAVASGYRDIKFFLDLPIADGYHICELQMNIGLALVAKELEHPIYEIIRRANPPPNFSSVRIPAREVKKLGGKLRAVYVMIKQKGMLLKARQDQLRSVVEKFFDRTESVMKAKTIDVTIPALSVQHLAEMTPTLYRYYEQVAMQAKVMTEKGFSPQMTFSEFEKLT